MRKLLQKIGLVAAGALLVALVVCNVFGAVTPNSIITTQSVSTSAHVIATGDQTTPALLFAAGANGTKIFKILVGPDDDGAGVDREISIYVYDGANSRRLCVTDVGADDAADIIPEDVIVNVPMAVDSNGNKFLEIPSGYSIYVSAENVAATNAVVVLKQDY